MEEEASEEGGRCRAHRVAAAGGNRRLSHKVIVHELVHYKWGHFYGTASRTHTSPSTANYAYSYKIQQVPDVRYTVLSKESVPYKWGDLIYDQGNSYRVTINYKFYNRDGLTSGTYCTGRLTSLRDEMHRPKTSPTCELISVLVPPAVMEYRATEHPILSTSK